MLLWLIDSDFNVFRKVNFVQSIVSINRVFVKNSEETRKFHQTPIR